MKISETKNADLTALVLAEYSRAYKVTGYSMPSASDLTERVMMTVEDLRESFSGITTDDVVKSFRKGALGDLGDFAGISVKTVHQWIRIATASDGRVNRVVHEDTAPLPERTPEERKYYARKLVNSCYKGYCNDNNRCYPARRLLDILQSDRLIDMTEERVKWAEAKAVEALKNKSPRERSLGQSLVDFMTSNTDDRVAHFIIEGFFNEMIEAKKTEIYENLEKPETITEEL